MGGVFFCLSVSDKVELEHVLSYGLKVNLGCKIVFFKFFTLFFIRKAAGRFVVWPVICSFADLKENN